MSALPEIHVSARTYERISLLARAWLVSQGEAVDRLLDNFQQSGQGGSVQETGGRMRIHAIYEGNRTDGLFDPESEVVEILSGPLAGRRFRSPSGAAVAVVQAAKPSIQPNRNGWSFWTVTDTGQILYMVRRRR